MNLRIDLGELNGLLNRVSAIRHRRVALLLVPGTIAVGLLLMALSEWLLGREPTSLFALAVVGCTGLLGLAAGLVTAATVALTIDFFYIPPIFSFTFDSLTLRYALGFGALAVCTHLIERGISMSIRKQRKRPLGVQGAVDGLVDGQLYGWALDVERPANPVTLTIFVNQRAVASTAAVYYRPDVAKKLNCSGQYGFYFDLAKELTTGSEALVEVRLPDGSALANAHSQIRIPAIGERPAKPSVLYMHIPRTAGTALREGIAANFLQSEIAYIYPAPPGFPVNDLRALPLEQRHGFRAVMGHFQFGIHEALPQTAEYITVVREPAARLLSLYRDASRFQPEILMNGNGRVMTLPELFEKRLPLQFDNALVRYFSGIAAREFPAGELTQEAFDKALENLQARFVFVGHRETLDADFARLRRRYHWNAKETLNSINASPSQGDGAIAPGVVAAMRHHNSWDFRFYREILRLFPLTQATSFEHCAN